MNDTDWRIKGIGVANCNCAWGCPCQFNGLPTTGQCEAVWAMHIEEGHHDGTRLDGLDWGFLLWWPGAVHEGNGRLQIFGDERATPEQRRALEDIGHGKASDEGTYFHIFAAVAPNFEPSAWGRMSFDCDLERRRASVHVDGLLDTNVEPLLNPVTQAEHRARIDIPDGFEYRQAEVASGTTRASGAIQLDLKASHTHIARVGWDRHGVLD